MAKGQTKVDAGSDPRLVAAGYHQRTKHHYDRYADSPGYLDWATQPDPFRRFIGAEMIQLRFSQSDHTPSYDLLYEPGAIEPQPVNIESLSTFCFYSLALSAWKQYGASSWSLRVNPSSGNLHPTEGYLLLDALEGLTTSPGLYHYAPKEHGLEHRARFSDRLWSQLATGWPANVFFVALSTIFWRESWKYGERAYRYCQHDTGHALAALRMAAALLGWRLVVINDVSDTQLENLLGLNRDDAQREHEQEAAQLLAAVVPQHDFVTHGALDVLDAVADNQWYGAANQLSPDHHSWQAIDVVQQACYRQSDWQLKTDSTADVAQPITCEPCPHSAGRIIRQRRSALDMDGQTPMTRDRFYTMLSRVVPGLCPVPWDAMAWPICVHLGLFVHRVTGLAAGLYALVRDPSQFDALRGALRSEFVWQKPSGCPETLAFYLLAAGDCQSLAARVSCHQNLAGAGAFSLGMLANYDDALSRYGAPMYRYLFWETGMIGQVLYLEAEAAGLRGTGIGCFFDDAVHETMGITDTSFQSLYHFSVGGPVEDRRLTSLPAYPRTVNVT